MGFTCSFLHNQTYTADDVNKAFARLTTQGVSLFRDTGNALTDLDTAASNLIENGVELFNSDACKVVQIAAEQYKVMPGTAFMPNGEAIVVDEEGHTFAAELGTAWNVVMFVAGNAGYIQAQEDGAPADGITIATIAMDGTITDARTFAKTKVAPATANIVQEISVAIGNVVSSGPTSHTVEIGSAMFNRIVFLQRKTSSTTYPLGTCPGQTVLTDGVESGEINLLDNGTCRYTVNLKKDGNILHMDFNKYSGSGGGDAGTITFIVF